MKNTSTGSIDLDPAELKKLTKSLLVERIIEQHKTLAAKEKQIEDLIEQLDQHQQQEDEHRQKEVNKTVNQPSSKKPEWDKDGNPKPKKRKPKRSKRQGSGNQQKTREPDETHFTPLTHCPACQEDISQRRGTSTAGRIVEDIDPPAEKTTVTKEVEEMKWCPTCQRMVSSKTDKALPGSDIGLNALIKIAYLWVMSALSLPKIQALCDTFTALTLSTSGMSLMMIRLSGILKPVYDEILGDVKQGAQIWADETGWRVKGKLWWLWIFANKRSAYYWAAPCRGGAVVESVLGPLFYGILIVDGWSAYNKIACAKQTCMAHIFRKIRAFIDAYPQYRSMMTFYLKLRRIIKHGKKLQRTRQDLDDVVFKRRLKALHRRLDKVLMWKNPNDVLKEIIKKVKRQRQHILTFIEHEGAESHNNYGEYIIKKGVLKRKVSGGSMSAEGASAYACIQSIAMTCQLRHLSFHHFMKTSLVHFIRTGKPMLLSEYETTQQQPVEKAAQ